MIFRALAAVLRLKQGSERVDTSGFVGWLARCRSASWRCVRERSGQPELYDRRRGAQLVRLQEKQRERAAAEHGVAPGTFEPGPHLKQRAAPVCASTHTGGLGALRERAPNVVGARGLGGAMHTLAQLRALLRESCSNAVQGSLRGRL